MFFGVRFASVSIKLELSFARDTSAAWGRLGGPVPEQCRAGQWQRGARPLVAGRECTRACGACAYRKYRETVENGPAQARPRGHSATWRAKYAQSAAQGYPATAGSERAPEGTHMRRLEKGQQQRRPGYMQASRLRWISAKNCDSS